MNGSVRCRPRPYNAKEELGLDVGKVYASDEQKVRLPVRLSGVSLEQEYALIDRRIYRVTTAGAAL